MDHDSLPELSSSSYSFIQKDRLGIWASLLYMSTGNLVDMSIYIYIYIYIYGHVSVYIYIYICVCVCVYIYIYIYIYIPVYVYEYDCLMYNHTFVYGGFPTRMVYLKHDI